MSLSGEFSDLHDFRGRETRVLRNLIESKSDLTVHGISGSGKTTIICDIIRDLQIAHVKLNCIQCSTKSTLIQSILLALEKKFNVKLKTTTKMSGLLERIGAVDERLRETNSPSLSSDPFYIILDNIERLDVSLKFFSQLLRIKHILHINFSVIFCGLAFKDQLLLENSDLELLPRIVLQPISDTALTNIVKNQVYLKLKQSEQPSFEVFGLKFVSDIVANFRLLIKNVNQMVSIALRLFRVFILNQKQIISKPNAKEFPILIKSTTYTAARKLLLNDPYLIEGDEKSFIEKVAQSQRALDSSDVTTVSISSTLSVRLQLIPAIILVACWIGNRNSESFDKKFFKDNKGRSGHRQGNRKEKQDGGLVKAVKVERLIALTQSIMSQSETLNTDRINTEIAAYNQTLDFYASIALLVQMGFIEQATNEQELSRAAFVSYLDEFTVKSIDSFHKLRMTDFLFRRD